MDFNMHYPINEIVKILELVTTPATSPLSINAREVSIKFISVEVAIIFLG